MIKQDYESSVVGSLLMYTSAHLYSIVYRLCLLINNSKRKKEQEHLNMIFFVKKKNIC